MKVSELMTKNPASVTPEQSLREAAAAMEKADCGCLPVTDNGNGGKLIGVITDRDITTRGVAQGKGPDTSVREVMSSNPKCCSADDDVEVVERIMAEEQVRRVPVVDQSGQSIGMVSQADIALAAQRSRDISDRDVVRVVECVSAPSVVTH